MVFLELTRAFCTSLPTCQTEWVWKSQWHRWEFVFFVSKLCARSILNISADDTKLKFNFFFLSGKLKGLMICRNSIQIWVYATCKILLNKTKCDWTKEDLCRSWVLGKVLTWWKWELFYKMMMQMSHVVFSLSVLLFRFFCLCQSHASASLLSSWLDVVTGLERQGYTVSLFCHLSPLALTGPNTCIQTPTAQPINHCLLIQYKRKFAQGARLRHYQWSVPIYFGPVLFNNWMSDMKG